MQLNDRVVGGWSFVPIITTLFLLFCYIIVLSNSNCLWVVSQFIFYGYLKLRFPDVEVNPGPRTVPQCCRVMFSNINGLHCNRNDPAIAATKFDVVSCVETKVTGRRHVSELFCLASRLGSTSAIERC